MVLYVATLLAFIQSWMMAWVPGALQELRESISKKINSCRSDYFDKVSYGDACFLVTNDVDISAERWASRSDHDHIRDAVRGTH